MRGISLGEEGRPLPGPFTPKPIVLPFTCPTVATSSWIDIGVRATEGMAMDAMSPLPIPRGELDMFIAAQHHKVSRIAAMLEVTQMMRLKSFRDRAEKLLIHKPMNRTKTAGNAD
jgi:hypothetical protein